MRVSSFIKIVASLVVLALVVATVIVMQRMDVVRSGGEVPAARNKVEGIVPDYRVNEAAIGTLLAKLDVEHIPDITPGLRAYEAACVLLEAGEFIAAEEKLQYVNAYYPSADVAVDARRVIGEMNLDSLFDPAHPKVSEYEVQKGDSFYKIVNAHDMSLDFLMFLNGLHRVDRLYPGQKLKVMPQEFTLRIDLKHSVISLWDAASFVIGYQIRSHSVPQRELDQQTELVAIEGHIEGKRVNGPGSIFRDADKVLVLKSPQIEIRAVGTDEAAAGMALFIDRSDLEELAVLLRPTNSVEIRY